MEYTQEIYLIDLLLISRLLSTKSRHSWLTSRVVNGRVPQIYVLHSSTKVFSDISKKEKKQQSEERTMSSLPYLP